MAGAAALPAIMFLLPARVAAQTSFVAPDGRNRFPGVTIFCPSGTGVAPCSFGGGVGSGGAVSLNLGGSAVSATNKLPVSDAALDALIGGGALNVGGTVAVSAMPSMALAAGSNTIGGVMQAGNWMVNLATGLPGGTNAIGTVGVSNWPAIQEISGNVGINGTANVTGSVAVSALPALPAGTNAIGSVSVSNLPATQAVSGSVGISGTAIVAGSVAVSSLPPLPAGTSTIGAVTIAGTPTFTCSGCGGGAGGTVTQGVGSSANPWWMQGLGVAGTPAGGVMTAQGVAGGIPFPVTGAFWQAVQPVSGTIAISSLPAGNNGIGSVSVSNLPATQAVSAATLPLPAGAALDASVLAVRTALGSPMQQTGGMLAVTNFPATQAVSLGGLPPLAAGNAAIGSVSVSNLPSTQAVSAVSLPLPAGAALDTSVLSVKTALGSPMQQTGGIVTVSNLPATQAVLAASLPLPTGAATAAAQTATLAPVSPGGATATSAVLLGCQASVALPTFAAGQQGAVPCDTAGHLYVVTVPSANNVPSYLQAVTSGGAVVFRAINAAASSMASQVKTGNGMVYGYEACNSGASAAYLRLFAINTLPVVGTSVPQVTKLLPSGACQTMTTSIGLVFTGGIALDVTSGSMADNDTTTVAAANQVTVAVYYK